MNADERVREAERRGDWARVVVEAIRAGFLTFEQLNEVEEAAKDARQNIEKSVSKATRIAEADESRAKLLALGFHVGPLALGTVAPYLGVVLVGGTVVHALHKDLFVACKRGRTIRKGDTLYPSTWRICERCKNKYEKNARPKNIAWRGYWPIHDALKMAE